MGFGANFPELEQFAISVGTKFDLERVADLVGQFGGDDVVVLSVFLANGEEQPFLLAAAASCANFLRRVWKLVPVGEWAELGLQDAMFELVHFEVAAKLAEQVGFVRRNTVCLIPSHAENEVVGFEVSVAWSSLIATRKLLRDRAGSNGRGCFVRRQ